MIPVMKEFPEPNTVLTHRISYGETDAMGLVYYAEYLHLFERSRGHYIREHGMSYAEVERRGIFLPVREAGCRYQVPCRYDEIIHIKAGIMKWGRASMDFYYEIFNEDRSKRLAYGYTQHAAVTPEGKPTAVPEWLRELFS